MLFKSKKGMQISTKIWLTYFWIAGFLKLVSTRPNWGAQETQLWGPKSNLPSIPFIASLLCYTIFHWTFEVVSVGPNVSSEAICRHIWLQVEPPTSDICALVSILTFKMYFSVFTPFSLYFFLKITKKIADLLWHWVEYSGSLKIFAVGRLCIFFPIICLFACFWPEPPCSFYFCYHGNCDAHLDLEFLFEKKKQLKGLRNLL